MQTIIEINALENGAHRNQILESGYDDFIIPEGWAIVPDGMETQNFPFGSIAVEEINGIMTVTNWTPGMIPKPEPEPKPDSTLADRVSALENAIAEGLHLYEGDIE